VGAAEKNVLQQVDNNLTTSMSISMALFFIMKEIKIAETAVSYKGEGRTAHPRFKGPGWGGS